MERRSMTRHDMKLACHVGPSRVLSRPLDGMVENMSRGGMLLRWEESAPVPLAGTRLVVEVELPAHADFGPRVMRCHTSVVRVVDRTSRRQSVALKIEQIRFVDRPKSRQINIMTMPSASRKVN